MGFIKRGNDQCGLMLAQFEVSILEASSRWRFNNLSASQMIWPNLIKDYSKDEKNIYIYRI